MAVQELKPTNLRPELDLGAPLVASAQQLPVPAPAYTARNKYLALDPARPQVSAQPSPAATPILAAGPAFRVGRNRYEGILAARIGGPPGPTFPNGTQAALPVPGRKPEMKPESPEQIQKRVARLDPSAVRISGGTNESGHTVRVEPIKGAPASVTQDSPLPGGPVPDGRKMAMNGGPPIRPGGAVRARNNIHMPMPS